MNTIRLAVTGIILLAFTMNLIGAAQEDRSPDELVDDIEEYNGSIGPENALYGLKLAFEGLDESFTINTTEKLEKKIYHSRLRISEAKAELNRKNDEGARKAFKRYDEKVKETEDSISEHEGNDSGILNAQKMITKHQYILERLLELHPNNSGLMNAYNNSIELEDKFEEKTARKLERIQTKEGKHYLRESKKEDKEDSEDDDHADFENQLKLEAIRIDNNTTQVKVELDFVSNKTDNESIANEIIDQLKLSKDNISSMIRIEDSNDAELKSSLKAEAKVTANLSEVEVEYKFFFNETNRTEIIKGIYNELSNLESEQIIDVLEIKPIQDKVREEEDDRERDITGNENKSGLIEKEDRIETGETEQKSDMEEKKDNDDNEQTRQEQNRTRDD